MWRWGYSHRRYGRSFRSYILFQMNNGTNRCRKRGRSRRSPSSIHGGPNRCHGRSNSSMWSPYGHPYNSGRYRSSLYNRSMKWSRASLNGTRRYSCKNGRSRTPS